MRYLRVKKDGFIYEWNSVLARNPLCEEVSELEAYPERFVNAAVEKARKRSKKIDLTTDNLPEEPLHRSPELEADASRGLAE